MFRRLAASLTIVVTIAGFWTPTAMAGSGAITKPACCGPAYCQTQFSRPACCQASPGKEIPSPLSTVKVSMEKPMALGGLIVIVPPMTSALKSMTLRELRPIETAPLFNLKSSLLI